MFADDARTTLLQLLQNRIWLPNNWQSTTHSEGSYNTLLANVQCYMVGVRNLECCSQYQRNNAALPTTPVLTPDTPRHANTGRKHPAEPARRTPSTEPPKGAFAGAGAFAFPR